MKKLLLLTALFTSLLIGFAACSDNEPEVELDADDVSIPFGIGIWETNIDNLTGELVYVKGKDAYQFVPDKSYSTIDSLKWLGEYKLRYRSCYTDSIKEVVDRLGSRVVLSATVTRVTGSNIAEISESNIRKIDSSRSGSMCGTVMGPPPAWFFEPNSREE